MNRPFNPHLQAGFTLLEMAIVLTVIGLIIGGTVVIRDMIRNAQVQSVINDEDRYKKAIQLFKEKYNYLPGDMPTATTFWGTDGNCTSEAYSAAEAVPKTATCNGDGNGHIGDTFLSSVGAPSTQNAYEWFRAWQQLADAGFIEGSYTGVTGPVAGINGPNSDAVPGANVPASQLPSAGFTIYYLIPTSSADTNVDNYPASNGNILAFGARYAGWSTTGTALTPGEALNIDTKLDDGLPGTGNVQAETPAKWPNCATSSNPSIAQYKTNYTGIACDLLFMTGL